MRLFILLLYYGFCGFFPQQTMPIGYFLYSEKHDHGSDTFYLTNVENKSISNMEQISEPVVESQSATDRELVSVRKYGDHCISDRMS